MDHSRLLVSTQYVAKNYEFKPQIKEGITACRWVSEEDIIDYYPILENMFVKS